MVSAPAWVLVAALLVTSVGGREAPPRPLLRGAARLQEATARLPLPDRDAIKKVAQILLVLGEQVIPAIIGELPRPPAACAASSDEPANLDEAV